MREKPRVNFVKTTLVGGLLFLVPVAFLLFILGKALGVMMVVARPMAGWIPIDRIGGVAVANLIALAVLVLVCFIAGLLARNAMATRAVRRLEERVLMKIPGYAVVRGLKSGFDESEEAHMKPVIADLGFGQRIGFEMQKLADGRSVLYLPGCPNTWSGITMITTSKQISYLDVPFKDIIDLSEGYGFGTAELLDKTTGPRVKA